MYISYEKLLQLRALAEKASPAPWKIGNRGVVNERGQEVCLYAAGNGERSQIEQGFRNGDYIAAIDPEVLACILDDLSEARARNRELLEILQSRGYGTEEE